jgi:hypothetical protein
MKVAWTDEQMGHIPTLAEWAKNVETVFVWERRRR